MNGRKAILNEVINGYEITVFETQLIIRNINQKPSQSWFTIIKMNIDGKQSQITKEQRLDWYLTLK